LIYIETPKGDVVAITSVDVDKGVIAEIKKLTGLKTDREVIHESLTRTLALARQQELLTRMKSRVFSDDQLSKNTIDYSQ
jgi:Arc/MetJ family transcription regulator